MEIVNLVNDKCQVIESSTGQIMFEGSYDDCFICLTTYENEDEMYAIIEKMNGNGMCDVMCMDGEIRLLHIRGKFKGRGKRDNIIDKTSWLLIGIRDYETVKEGKRQNCDLLEVYNSSEKDKLKLTVTNVNWKNFISKDNIINNTDE